MTAPPRVRTYRYTTITATCSLCGRVRLLKITKSPKRLEQALERRCRKCAGSGGGDTTRLRQAEVDEMAVERLVAGDPPETTTRAERSAAVAVLVARGLTNVRVAELLGITDRTVQRLRSAL